LSDSNGNDKGGTSGDSNLDAAWRLLSLRLVERSAPGFDYDEYLSENYSVEFEPLYKFYEAMMEDEDIDHEIAVGLFVVAFEFGKLHERYIKDMEFLS
jgi:hypothetical protein